MLEYSYMKFDPPSSDLGYHKVFSPFKIPALLELSAK